MDGTNGRIGRDEFMSKYTLITDAKNMPDAYSDILPQIDEIIKLEEMENAVLCSNAIFSTFLSYSTHLDYMAEKYEPSKKPKDVAPFDVAKMNDWVIRVDPNQSILNNKLIISGSDEKKLEIDILIPYDILV